MFVGYVDNQILFATSQPKGKEIISGTLTDEINSVSALEFTLPPSNDMAGQITPHASIIRLESDGAEIFRGTANSVSKNFRGDTVVSCDGMIALMADVIRAPGAVSGVNTKSYITALITNYNSGVADNRHISAGIIDEFGTFTTDHSQECKNIFELLKEVLSDKGGYIWASYVGGDVRINYTSTIGRRNNQQIAFGSNLVNIEDQLEVGTLVTRVWPLGKDGLTIASVNNNIIYLQNEEVEMRYGRVDKTIQVDSDDPSVVKSYGQAYLTRYAAMNNTITLTAIDLHNLDKKISSFEVGDAVRVLSPPHGIDAEMIVNSVSTDLVQLSNSRITLGGKKGSITSVISSGGSGGSGGVTGGVGGGGASITVDSALSLTSTNPVENKVITSAMAGKLDKTGGTLTGNLTGKYITGTWLQTTEATDLGRVPGKIAVLDDSGWVYYRTPAELKSDIAASASGADNIESKGTTGVWTWRKWASGIAEMWAVFEAESLAIDEAWGSLYFGTWMRNAINVSARNYPFAFVETPTISATYMGGGSDAWLVSLFSAYDDPLTKAPAYALARPNTATILAPRISYYVVGKYK